MSSGKDSTEFRLGNVGEQGVVLCAFDPGSGNELAATLQQSAERITFNARAGGAEYELYLKADHASAVSSLLGENLEVFRCDAILRPPGAEVPQLSKQIAPGCESLRQGLPRLEAGPQTHHLAQRRHVRDHQVE